MRRDAGSRLLIGRVVCVASSEGLDRNLPAFSGRLADRIDDRHVGYAVSDKGLCKGWKSGPDQPFRMNRTLSASALGIVLVAAIAEAAQTRICSKIWPGN